MSTPENNNDNADNNDNEMYDCAWQAEAESRVEETVCDHVTIE